MPIRFRCRHCQQLLGIARRKAGQSVRCPTCRREVTVPHEDEEPSPRPPAGAFDVEPAAPDPAWPLPVPPPPGLVLSSQQVTLLAVAAVVLLAVSFAAGVLVGRFVL
jgi:phage FluMu protein Com